MQGMPRVRATLEAGHGRITPGQNVHNLAFPLVSPLEAKDNVKF